MKIETSNSSRHKHSFLFMFISIIFIGLLFVFLIPVKALANKSNESSNCQKSGSNELTDEYYKRSKLRSSYFNDNNNYYTDDYVDINYLPDKSIYQKETQNIAPDYLKFTAQKESSTIVFNPWHSEELQISKDNGQSWTDYSPGLEITLNNVGDEVLFKGYNTLTSMNNNFVLTGKIAASGSVTSLTDANGGNKDVQLTRSCYSGMFFVNRDDPEAQVALTLPPKLPSVNLAEHCYQCMFKFCEKLETVPDLPARDLKDSCYAEMFDNCTSLVYLPSNLLPAGKNGSGNLASTCYCNMFICCEKLKNCPELPATSLEDSCYERMFAFTKSLDQTPELPATVLSTNCYRYMFVESSINVAQKLPATKLAKTCYYAMFENCSNLVNPPELPSVELASGCYAFMFNGCTRLLNPPSLPATNLPESIHNPSATIGCYTCMFQLCSSLQSAPNLPATELKDSCYDRMFSSCLKLSHAVALPATELKMDCYLYMFASCCIDVPADISHVTKLSDCCCYGMYDGCTNLKIYESSNLDHQCKWQMPTAAEAKDWSFNMLCSTTGDFVNDPQVNKIYYTKGYNIDNQNANNCTITLSSTKAVVGENINFNVTAGKNYTIKDISVIDSDNNSVSLIEESSNNYYFSMPSCDVSIIATTSYDKPIQTDEINNPSNNNYNDNLSDASNSASQTGDLLNYIFLFIILIALLINFNTKPKILKSK